MLCLCIKEESNAMKGEPKQKQAVIPMSVEVKCGRLQELAVNMDFGDKTSITYNAAMYYLISVLETRHQERNGRKYDKKEVALNLLRNGLVHGHFEVDPELIKR